MSDASPVPPDLLAHAAFVRRLVRTLLLDAHGAEDVVQETWRRSLESPPERRGELRAWLARVARNLAFQRRRSDGHRRERELRAARAEELPAADASLERTEMLQRVVDAVRALEEPYRATILARFYEGLPPRAIAAREHVSVETVNSRLKRALARLRERLERDRGDWRPVLGLLADESPCLPPHAGEAVVLASTKSVVSVTVVLAVVLVGGWSLWSSGPSGARSTPIGLLPESSDEDASMVAGAPPASRLSVPTDPAEIALSGRVLDEAGNPVPEAGVIVWVPEEGGLGRQSTHACDAEGRWEAALAGPCDARIFLQPAAALQTVEPGEGAHGVHAPAAGIDFVVRRVPTGTIEVRVVEGARREPVHDFKVSVHGGLVQLPGGGTSYEGGYSSMRATGSVLRAEWRTDDPAGVPLRVTLLEPDLRGLWSRLFDEPGYPEQEMHLLPGEIETVLFVLPERGVLRGQVVDHDGVPVADALVYFGPWTRGRGDEPFKPLRVERITDGARTGADGWFELRGEGALVTAAHPGYSSATVKVEQAERIVLGPRGTIRGRVLDTSGRPAAGQVVLLGHPADGRSRSLEATADAAGAFVFERLEAGAHALWIDTGGEEGEFLAGVRLAEGAEAEVELWLGSASPLELDVPGLAPEDRAGLEGVLVGLDETFGLCWFEEGSVQGRALPGRYWLVTRDGIAAPVTVVEGDPVVRVEIGAATLVVRSGERQNVQVVPQDADGFTRLVAARAWVKAAGEAEARFRLAPGRYLLVGEAGAVLRELDLPPGGAQVELE